MADCQGNGRIRENCRSLTSIFSELYIDPPDSKYLFILGLFLDFTVDKCESQDILAQSNLGYRSVTDFLRDFSTFENSLPLIGIPLKHISRTKRRIAHILESNLF
jgi:hypothetical protein